MDWLGFVWCLECLLDLGFSDNDYKMNPITKTWALKQDCRNEYMKDDKKQSVPKFAILWLKKH